MPTIPAFIFALAVLLAGCTDSRCHTTQKEVQALMKDQYKKKIRFPHGLEALNPPASDYRLASLSPPHRSSDFTIVHFFKADCDKCIHELEKIQAFLKGKAGGEEVNYLFIASAPTKFYAQQAVEKLRFPYPVFYEKTYYSFKNLNGLPLENDLYNTMLLNKGEEVLLFGSFYSNKKAEELFYQTISCGQ